MASLQSVVQWSAKQGEHIAGHITTSSVCSYRVKAATDSTCRDKYGCFPIKLDLWTPKCEFHIIFTGHEMVFFF